MSKPTAPRSTRQSTLDTRQRVIDAAILCISRDGFHRATSNRIAEEAGMTWGVIQYHFADKEGILKAVLDSVFDGYTAQFAQAEAGSGTLYQRVYVLIERLWEEFNKPGYLASIEIIQNLNRDPKSRINTRNYLNVWGKQVSEAWDHLFPELEHNRERSQQTKRVLFAALRGFVDNRFAGQPVEDMHGSFEALASAVTYLLNAAPAKTTHQQQKQLLRDD